MPGDIEKVSERDLNLIGRILAASYLHLPRGIEYLGPSPKRNHGGRRRPAVGHPLNINQRVRLRMICGVARLLARREIAKKRKQYAADLARTLLDCDDAQERAAARRHLRRRYAPIKLGDLFGGHLREWGVLPSDVPPPSRVSLGRWSRDYRGSKVTPRQLEDEILRWHRAIQQSPRTSN